MADEQQTKAAGTLIVRLHRAAVEQTMIRDVCQLAGKQTDANLAQANALLFYEAARALNEAGNV